jgi:hypothetical protein
LGRDPKGLRPIFLDSPGIRPRIAEPSIILYFVTNGMLAPTNDDPQEPKGQIWVVNSQNPGMSVDHLRAMRKSYF